ncbi:MAG: transglycosylase domain-containing protein, partial [Akkermansiaceae bacterium]|nr:transglycosylase domain-containing protein [Akkermansiaceae bacterium]
MLLSSLRVKRIVINRRRLLRRTLVLVLLWTTVWFGLPWLMPLPPALLDSPHPSPTILDRHGEVIEHLTLPDFTRSAPVSLSEIPADFINCTLAAEDKRFFKHGGVDLLATARAVADALTHRRVASGASTITQQLIKISSPPRSRNLFTKLREALAARHLEMIWSKQRILEAYLNRLNYGSLRLGPAEAARWYFQKPMTDLSLAESALLAGLPQAPTRPNPLSHPAAAIARRN